MNYNVLVAMPWLVFIVWWLISALDVKKTAYQSTSWRRWGVPRILLIAACIIVLPHTKFFGQRALSAAPAVRIAGMVACVAGIAFAIWARVTLGRNWSGVPSLKDGHELITAGPYRLVRHPIYTGALVALLGSALAAGPVWLAIFAIAAVTFAFRVPREERLMMQQFPNQYPEYAKRTKALIPFAL